MSNIQIFVEGIADQKFFQDLIEKWYNIKLSKGEFADRNTRLKFGDIFDMGGKDSFEDVSKTSVLDPIIETLRFEDIPMLVIFDADTYVTSKPIIEELCRKRTRIHICSA